MTRRLAVTVAFVLFAGSMLAGQSDPSYRDIVTMYREARYAEAVAAARALPAESMERQLGLLISADRLKLLQSPEAMRVDHRVWLQAALMLHTEVLTDVWQERRFSPGAEITRHTKAAKALLEALQTTTDRTRKEERDGDNLFLAVWYLHGLASAQARSSLVEASVLGVNGRKQVGDVPELLLAIGAVQELAWTLEHDGDVRLAFRGDLKEADANYRAALIGNPGLVEARVRLGRVLSLRDDYPGAVSTLEPALAASTEEGFRYLATLFTGDVFERRGDLVHAAESYEAAIAILPAGQSARVALAEAKHAAGSRADAYDRVRQLADENRRTDDTADPWVWYIRGTAWRQTGYLEAARQMVKSS